MRITPHLIISLIKDDLLNTRLVNGLNAMGLEAANYYLHLDESIFTLMGISSATHGEEILERYLSLCEQVNTIDVENNKEGLQTLAENIYETLLMRTNMYHHAVE